MLGTFTVRSQCPVNAVNLVPVPEKHHTVLSVCSCFPPVSCIFRRVSTYLEDLMIRLPFGLCSSRDGASSPFLYVSEKGPPSSSHITCSNLHPSVSFLQSQSGLVSFGGSCAGKAGQLPGTSQVFTTPDDEGLGGSPSFIGPREGLT